MSGLPHSASSLERDFACPPNTVLPRSNTSTTQGNTGTDVHRFLRRVPDIGAEAALSEVPEESRELCESIDLDVLPLGAPFRGEVAFAVNVVTGEARELGQDLGRKYELRENEVPGTADVVAVTSEGVHVADFKVDGWEPTSTPPARNRQLRFLALAACQTYGKHKAHVALIHINADGSSWEEGADLDAIDLIDTLEDLRGIVAAAKAAKASLAEGVRPATNEGSHCRYCPAITVCPAKIALVSAAGRGDFDLAELVEGHVAELSDADAGLAWVRVKALTGALEIASNALKTRASSRPIPLPDGTVVMVMPQTRESVDAEVVQRVLSEKYGAIVGTAAVETKLKSSKARIKKALASVVKERQDEATRDGTKRPSAESIKEEALDALRSANGVSENVIFVTKEQRPAEMRRATRIASSTAAAEPASTEGEAS